jgi:hypothetical protein
VAHRGGPGEEAQGPLERLVEAELVGMSEGGLADRVCLDLLQLLQVIFLR